MKHTQISANGNTAAPCGRERAYFAAANTGRGFYSHFPQLFDPQSGKWERIYIIKGGPGTGKSSLMKRVLHAAQDRGYETEAFFCSSDTSSLDGLIIPALGTAILDGTSPHTVDAVYPGAVEEILNMGDFFDTQRLRQSFDEIRLQKQKNAAAHKRAGTYLTAAAEIHRSSFMLARTAFDRTKAERAAERIVCRCKREAVPVRDVRFVSAIGVHGNVHLKTAEEGAANCIYVCDKRGLAAFFFDCLIRVSDVHGISYTRFAPPLDPDETEGVFFPSLNTVYFTDRYGKCRDDAQLLNTDRFLIRESFSEIRGRYRFSQKCFHTLMDGAYTALAEAGDAHERLESYYVSAMDFRALDAFTARFIQSLFL